jgi:hypothetical protein
MGHHSTWSLRGAGCKAANPARDRSDFLVGDGLPLAVSCIRSSTIIEGSRRDEISRLISGIFSYHSAEYLAHMIASPGCITAARYKHNRGEIMYTVCRRAAAEGPSASFQGGEPRPADRRCAPPKAITLSVNLNPKRHLLVTTRSPPPSRRGSRRCRRAGQGRPVTAGHRSDFERERLLHDGFVLTPVSLDA